MSDRQNIRINRSGAFRVKSAEAKPAKIVPSETAPPPPSSPTPKGHTSQVRALKRRTGR